jgi:hypothetical protein
MAASASLRRSSHGKWRARSSAVAPHDQGKPERCGEVGFVIALSMHWANDDFEVYEGW